MSQYGALDKSYHLGRTTRWSLRYRLRRRTEEVILSIKKHCAGNPENILDLGAADGLMLGHLKDTFPSAECLGIEFSAELVACNTDSRITVEQGDVNVLSVGNDSQDVAIATAIIEHLPDPVTMLKEAKRVLRPGGLMILTTPDPFWERVARVVGHLADDMHCRVMTLPELVAMLQRTGYEILEQKKFMLSPIGLPWEYTMERFVRSLGLRCLFANQLVVCRKPALVGTGCLQNAREGAC